MPRFRKRPVVIEAEQWFPGKPVEGVEPVSDGGVNEQGMGFEAYGVVQTLEGPHIAKPGDWIITGVKGERYPCKPDIFALTYEPVDEQAS